jgi:hypothetical protein
MGPRHSINLRAFCKVLRKCLLKIRTCAIFAAPSRLCPFWAARSIAPPAGDKERYNTIPFCVYFVCVGNLWKITFAQGTPKSTHEQNRNADQAIEIIGSGGENDFSMRARPIFHRPSASSASTRRGSDDGAGLIGDARAGRRWRPRQKKTPELSLRGLSFNRSGEDQK